MVVNLSPPSGRAPGSSRCVLNNVVPTLFETRLLTEDTAVATVISHVESAIADSPTDLDDIVLELVENPSYALEFVLSAVNEPTYRLLHTTFIRDFPNTPEAFLSSIAFKLLTRFSLFFLFLPNAHEARIPTTWIGKERNLTETSAAALRVLSKATFEDVEANMCETLDEFGEVEFAVKRKGQNKKKKGKRGGQLSEADKKALLAYGPELPTTKNRATQMIGDILYEQMEVFKAYLALFREEPVTPLIRTAYIPPPSSSFTNEPPSPDAQIAEPCSTEGTTGLSPPETLPPVLPMKAALYFDSADGFGEWRILISTRAERDLRQARKKDAKMFGIYAKKIKQLSKGHFSDDNQKRLTGLDVEIPIYEAKMTGDTRLVYQVDCIPEFESSVERQVLKIYGIYTHAQLDRRFWDCMGRHLERKGAEYRKRCTFRNPPVNRGDNVYTPACWPPPADPVTLEPVLGISDMRKEDLEELHSLLVLEKFVMFSQALLNSILADQDVAHVFNVTPQEQRIIEHPSSCYVLGRSGTGKTTTMLFKMLGIERAWESRRDSMPKPRQLFVTQSRVLAEKVEEYFVKLLDSLATASQSPTELLNIAKRKKEQQDQGLVDRDEEIYWRGDLPKRYGALKDEHFPMFVTYDHICRLLESEFHHSRSTLLKEEAASKALQNALQLQDPQSGGGATSNDYMQQRRSSFVSFGTFLEEYWSRFPQTLTKGLDPTLVFGEFMGVIKGSEQALTREEGYLDKQAYYNLSHRTQGTFANQRECIYKLFQAYLKRKKERGDYDAADRTHALIKSLKTMGVPGQDIDFIYVDEAQDNLLIDALVLRTLCRNPNGMFWAGDTAQTISVGSAFRFNDLKSFLYRYEEANAKSIAEKQTPPESFHLAVNYRSHGGIVNCAHSVIQLITEFWPHAIDALAQETGMIDGLKPVFFSGWDQNTVRYEQFLFGESGNHIEFGAEQCILVRDDAARDKLRAQVGDIGLIMTLYESKGLEFNDVLLYNFFEDSTVDLSQWRVVLNAIPPEERAKHPAPRFDDARHSGVCRDLKFLYVAITRARKNLWIADGSEKGEPMRIVWTYKDQIQNCTPGTDVPRLAMSSTAEDWAKTALSLFNNRRYMQAMHCYDRAGLFREKAVAHAYYLREVARSTPVTKGDSTAQALAFIDAAEAFATSAQDAVTEKKAYYRIAAECYVHSKDDYKAAQAYSSAAEYTLAAQHYRKAGKFDEAVHIVQSHKDKVATHVADSIVDVSRLYFLRERQLKKARALFETDEEALEYMDDYGLDVARASLMEDIGRYADAAELHLAEGNVLEAIRLLKLDSNNEASMKKAFDCLLDGLWRRLSCGVGVSEEMLKDSSTVMKLLQLTDGLQESTVGVDTLDEISMFHAITKRDLPALRRLAARFIKRLNTPAAFLCFDHLFVAKPKFHALSLREIVDQLQMFLIYARALKGLATVAAPCDDPTICKLFAIRISTEDSFLLHKDSYLASKCNLGSTPNFLTREDGILVPRWELDRLVKSVVKSRLLHRVSGETYGLYVARPLRPCLHFSIFSQCNRTECSHQHLPREAHNAETYNTRIRVHILQILIIQTLYPIQNSIEFLRMQRDWLRLLYDALFPPHYKLGGPHVLIPGLIPEWKEGTQVVATWARGSLYELDPRGSLRTFVTVFASIATLALEFSQKDASEYLQRIQSVAWFRPFMLCREPDKAYVVHDLLSLMMNDDGMSLNRGILFMNHVLVNKVPVDIGLLCDSMDHLCASLVVATRLRRNGTLHDTTLPKSWFLRIIPQCESLRSRDTQLSQVYTKHMADFLEQIYSGIGASHLLFDSRDFSSVGNHVRNTFFARVCKNICLWGYNQWRFDERNHIHRAITTVRKPGRTYHYLIEKYINARHWGHLARAVRHSAAESMLDEMVQLHHSSVSVPKASLPNVRRVVYTRTEDIPWLLKTDGSVAPSAGLRAEALPFVPTSISAKTLEEEELEAAAELQEENVTNEDGPEEAIDVDGITRAIDAERSEALATALSPQEIAAANTIANAYKRHLAHTNTPKPTALQGKRLRIFAAFSAQAQRNTWPGRYYRMLFLGPAAHLFVAVELMKDHLHEARSVAKKKFNVAQHLELEVVQSSLTQITRLFREAEKLHKALGPTANVHCTRDIEKLKTLTLQAETLMQSLPSSATQECDKEMKIALKGIVTVKKMPKKVPKPSLNMDDESAYGEDVEVDEEELDPTSGITLASGPASQFASSDSPFTSVDAVAVTERTMCVSPSIPDA